MPAQTLGLIPLDNRPCTSRYPQRIGRISGIDVALPPYEALGDLQHPADVEAFADWLLKNAPRCDALVVSLDALGYGGLIPSRQSDESLEVVMGRLERLKVLKERFPSLKIYAFSISMRLSKHPALEEEKPYWGTHGDAIFRFSYHLDRYRQRREPKDLAAAKQARQELPDEIIRDYLKTRSRNQSVLKNLINWAKTGLFECLVIGQDDTAEFGFNVAEKRHLMRLAGDDPRIRIYPGADEIATTLLSRYLNRDDAPAFYPVYSYPGGEALCAMYEDAPIRDSVARQAAAAGVRLVSKPEEADFTLFVNVPASGQGDLCLRIGLEQVDQPPRDLNSFVSEMRKAPHPVLVDLAYANGADPALFSLLARADLERLAGFAAWNTAGNSLGTVFAMASASRYGSATPFLLERVAEDYLYQTQLRQTLRAEGDLNPQKLTDAINLAWQHQYGSERFCASYPWQRFFEADIVIEESSWREPLSPSSRTVSSAD